MKRTASELIKSLSNERKSDTCFIIGGGSSLLKYLPDHSVLNNKDVITTNNAYKLFPNALVGHFADYKWYQWHKHIVHKIFQRPLTTIVRNIKYNYPPAITTFQKIKGHQVVLSKSYESLGGNNSGHQAINLAYLIGFKKIVLLGFDMNSEVKTTHWHNEHQEPTKTILYNSSMIPHMERLAKQLQDIEIFNINRQSALKCFKFADLEEFI